jgi:Fe-S-cluster containining protein
MKTPPVVARQQFGFTRTSCDCHDCSVNCRFVPGMLIPHDLEPLRWATGPEVLPADWARQNLLASPGALVASPKRGVFRIRTLVPARRPDGACKFLTADNRCAVHAVAPYGCAFFDAHMEKGEGLRRSRAGLVAIAEDAAVQSIYSQVWHLLHDEGLNAPSPEECRHRMGSSPI